MTDNHTAADIVTFAEEVLSINLLPWQVQLLEGMPVVHPRRAGRKRGIEQVHAVLDELAKQALWLDPGVELSVVYQVAAKYLPASTRRHASLPNILDLVV